MNIKDQRKVTSIVTLSNANMLVSSVVMNIAGNDISNAIGDSRLSHSMISALVQSRISEKLASSRT